MQNEIAKLLEAIVADYTAFQKALCRNRTDDYADRAIAEFKEQLDVTHGQKYIKIISGGSVWGFIVAVDDDKKFRKGDILKAAGFSTPARNIPRGNILDGGYSIRWTGPYYAN